MLTLLLANLFWGLSFPDRQGARVDARDAAAAGGHVVVDSLLYGGGGLLLAGGMLRQNHGLQFTAAILSAFVTQFYVNVIAVWLAVRAGRNPGCLVWSGCALVLAGVAMARCQRAVRDLDRMFRLWLGMNGQRRGRQARRWPRPRRRGGA